MNLSIEELYEKNVIVNGIIRKEKWGGIYYLRDRMQITKINESYYSFLILLKQTGNIYDAVRGMQEEYEIDVCTLKKDLGQLVKYMMKHGMITVDGYPMESLRELETNFQESEDSNFVLGVEDNITVAPMKVLIETTYNCNLRCVHCFADAKYCGSDYKSGILPGEMTTEEWKKVIDNLHGAGVFDLFVSGGECMMREDIFDLLSYIHEKGMGFFLLSNGTLIDEKKARYLKEIGCLKVECNMDGATAKSYDAFRGVKGAFDKTIKGIQACLNAGIPLRCNVMETRMNIYELEEIVKTCYKIGVKEVCVVPLEDGGRSIPNKERLKFTEDEYEKVTELYRKVDKWVHRVLKDEILLITPVSVAEKPMIMNVQHMPMCGAGKIHCTVTPYGDVKLCPADRDTFKDEEVNLLKRSLADIWKNSKILNEIRSSAFFKCSGCVNMRCNYGCPVVRYRQIHNGVDVEKNCHFMPAVQ